MSNYHMTRVSTNKKTGPIPVVTVSKDTCPTSCPLKGAGCYAEGGPLAIHWKLVTEKRRGFSFEGLLEAISSLPKKQLWRYGQAGDLPGDGDEINVDKMAQLVNANRSRPVIAFTHKPVEIGDNRTILRDAASKGFHINLSADNLDEADELLEEGLPVAVTLPEVFQRKHRKDTWLESLSEFRDRVLKVGRRTPKGHKVAICPATYSDTTCAECKACSVLKPGQIIGFPTHGHRKRMVDRRLMENFLPT